MRRVFERRPATLASVVIAALVAALAVGPPGASAQGEPIGPAVATSGGPAVLIVVDARLQGSGPWTAYLGAAPQRELVFTVVNAGSSTSTATDIVLRSSWGPAGGSLEAVVLEPLAPGERQVVRREVELPTAAIGTYSVSGSISGSTPAVSFRAETSHVPWALVVAPLLILVQLALVAARNRVRRRLTVADVVSEPVIVLPEAPPRAVASVDPASLDPASVVAEEVAAVFDGAVAAGPDGLGEDAMAVLVADLAGEAAGRVAARLALGAREQAELEVELARRMLGAFRLEGRAAALVG